MKESDILYELGKYWVCHEQYGNTLGFAVYRDGVTHSTRVARIGFAGSEGLDRAIKEVKRRNDQDKCGIKPVHY